MEAERVYKCGSLTVNVYHDPDPADPRGHDNLGKMVQFGRNRRFKIGDEQGWELETVKEMVASGEIAVFMLLSYSEQSGYIAGYNTTDFEDRNWDGAIFITREALLKEHSLKRLSKRALKLGLECLRAEVETYSEYSQGNVWGYEVVETGDSCWGFFGSNDKASGLLDNALGDEAKNAVLE